MTTRGTTTSVPVAPGVVRRHLPAWRAAALLVATAGLVTACGGGGFRSSAPYAGDIEPTLARPAPQLAERPVVETGAPPRPAEPLLVDAGPPAASSPPVASSPLPPGPQVTAEVAPSPGPVFSFGGTTAASPAQTQAGTAAERRPAAPATAPVRPAVPQLALAPPPPEPPAVVSASPRQGQAAAIAQATPATAPPAVDPQQFLSPRPAVPAVYPRLSSVPPTPPLPQARETARIQAQLAEDRAQLEAGRAPTSQRPIAAPASVQEPPPPVPAAPVIDAQAPPEPTRPSASASTGTAGLRTGLEAANLEPSGVEPPRGPFLVDRPARLPAPSAPAGATAVASAAPVDAGPPPRRPATPLPALPALAAVPAAQPETAVARAPMPQRAVGTEAGLATTPTAAGRIAPPETSPARQVASLPPGGAAPDPVRAAMQERFSQSGATGASELAALPVTAPRAIAPAGFQVAVLYFAAGESGLTEQNAAVLRQVAQAQRDRNAPLRIIGHALIPAAEAGPSTLQRRNFEVSLRRANTVAEALARLGVPTGAIQVTALGDTQPAGRPATSRRVQILMDL